MLGVSMDSFIYGVVRGLHAGQNSARAAGVKDAPEYLRLGEPTKALYVAFDIRVHY